MKYTCRFCRFPSSSPRGDDGTRVFRGTTDVVVGVDGVPAVDGNAAVVLPDGPPSFVGIGNAVVVVEGCDAG